ncbi:MAG: DUF11 domain-containing protein, partial [Bifidobacteriaceae bacterium]|nr:DUF11 domain-containing protein [Bifidobacteriaceae bacterium]
GAIPALIPPPATLLTWSGPLAANQTVRVSYTVLLEASGPDEVKNTVWSPNDPTILDPSTPRQVTPPACQDLSPPDGRDDATNEPCATVRDLLPRLNLTKTHTGGPTSRPGDVIAYTVVATNVGRADFTASNEAMIVDSLTDVLDDAVYNSNAAVSTEGANLSYDPVEQRLSWHGSLAVGDTVTLTYSVTLTGGGDGRLSNTVWRPDNPAEPPPACGPGVAVTCAVDTFDRPLLAIRKELLGLTKGPDGSITVADGDVVWHRITIENVGAAPFTQADPAVVVDTNANPHGGATFGEAYDDDGDPATNPVSTPPHLRWSGPLAARAKVQITYSVRLDARGNGESTNIAWWPADPLAPEVPTPSCAVTDPTDPYNASGVDPVTREACAWDYWRRPMMGLIKNVVTPGPYVPGMNVEFELLATNVSEVPYTVENPAWLVDDLSNALPGVVFDGKVSVEPPTAPPATYRAPRIEWSGPVGAGDTVRLTYTVTLGSAGPGTPRNVVWRPLTPLPGAPPACTDTTIRVDPVTGEACHAAAFTKTALSVAKTASAVSDDGTVTFTIAATNPGPGVFDAGHPAVIADDLSDLLARGTYLQDATADGPGTIGVVDGTTLRWDGPLDAGKTITITYSAKLKPGAAAVRNVAWAPNDPTLLVVPHCVDGAGDPVVAGADAATAQACATAVVARPGIEVTKTTDGTSASRPGDVVTYTVRIHNTRSAGFTEDHPAVVADDLAGVLDDADWLGTASASSGTVALKGSTLTWTGALAPDGTATFRYAVRLARRGDGVVTNVAWVPFDPDTLAPPSCEDAAGPHPDPATGEWCDRTEFSRPVPTVADRTDGSTEVGSPHLAVAKSVQAAGAVQPGGVVRYQIAVTNTGTAPFTDAAPAEVTDGLAGLLSVATWNDDLLATHGTATRSGPEVRWRGALAVGQYAVISYSLTLRGDATGTLVNTACAAESAGGACSEARLGIPALAVAKRLVGEGPDRRGRTVRFEVTATNTGTGDFTVTHPAKIRDDLADVLDDATFDAGSVSAIGGTGVLGTALAGTIYPTGGTLDNGVLRWAGPLAAGQTMVMTYSVTYSGGGNHVLTNRVCTPRAMASGEPCADVAVAGPAIMHTKTAKASSNPVRRGTVVTYTLRLVNAGGAAGVLDLVDPLDDVLDDSTWVSMPHARAVQGAEDAVSGSTVDARVEGGVLAITGRLGPHTTVDVVYRVRVTPGGNGDLLNYLAERTGDGKIPPAPSRTQCSLGTMYRDNCVLLSGEKGPGNQSGLANTGVAAKTGRLVLTMLALLVAGMGLIVMRRRRA